MKIYHYDDVTKEYIGSADARENPLEAGEYLVPRNATVTEPPAEQANIVYVWNGSSWDQVEDYRETEYWLADDYDEVVAPYVVESLGPMPEGALTTKPDVPTDVQAQRDKEATFAATVAAGYTFGLWTFRMDDNARKFWTETLAHKNNKVQIDENVTEQSTITIFDIDDVPRQMTIANFRQMVDELGDAYEAAFIAYKTS